MSLLSQIIATRSLPVRGAWVEIAMSLLSQIIATRSLPVLGAWVEIENEKDMLKAVEVAPRAGSVG